MTLRHAEVACTEDQKAYPCGERPCGGETDRVATSGTREH